MTAPYTLSSSYRVAKCRASLGLEGAEIEMEGQGAGTVRHAFIVAVAKKMTMMGWTELGDALAAAEEVGATAGTEVPGLDWDALLPFLRPGQWAHNVAVAWHPESGAATIIGHGLLRAERAVLAEVWRQERGFEPGSVVHGEADVVGLTADAVVVVDFKPPHGAADHEAAWRSQVNGYAAALRAAYGRSKAICAYLQLRPGARPVTWELDAIELDAVRAEHAETLRIHREGRGTYAIGPWCSYCPALRVCPQQVAALVSLGTLAPPSEDLSASAEAAAKELATAPDAVVEAAFVALKQFRGDNGLPEVMWRALRARVGARPVHCADGDVIGIRDVVDEVDWEIAARVLNALGFDESAVIAALPPSDRDYDAATRMAAAVTRTMGPTAPGETQRSVVLAIFREMPPAATKDSIRSAVQATMAPRARGNGAIHARVDEALAAAGAFRYHGKIAKFTPEST